MTPIAEVRQVDLPARAGDPVVVRSASGLAIAFRPREAGAITYERIEGGVEDRVNLAVRPAVERQVYDVDVHEVAGLRLVANSLEMLDAGGAPRLRVRAPYVVDAD